MGNSPTIVVCLALGGILAQGQALRQSGYLKAANPHMGDHFGNGGTLEGHGVALSGDGNTMAL